MNKYLQSVLSNIEIVNDEDDELNVDFDLKKLPGESFFDKMDTLRSFAEEAKTVGLELKTKHTYFYIDAKYEIIHVVFLKLPNFQTDEGGIVIPRNLLTR